MALTTHDDPTGAPAAPRDARSLGRLLRGLSTGQITRSAASLYGSTVVTSATGFFFWLVAARWLPAQAVGTASAVQSATQIVAILCVVGLGTLLVAELGVESGRTWSLVVTGVMGATLMSLAVSVLAWLALIHTRSLHAGLARPSELVVFLALSVATTAGLILDDACIGLGRGSIQLRRNAVFAVAKLLAVPALVAMWAASTGQQLVVAWLIGTVCSLVYAGYLLTALTAGQARRLDVGYFVERRATLVSHHWLNVAVQTPRLVAPVIVAVVVGTAANAAYTSALLVIGAVNIIPMHFSTALFALRTGDHATLRDEVRKSLLICTALAAISGPLLAGWAPEILRVFNAKYVTASGALRFLAATTFPITVKTQYVAISRVRGQMRRGARRASLGALAEIGLTAVGAWRSGLTGAGLGFLTATVIEAVLFGPTVWGVLAGGAPRPQETECCAP